MKTVLSVFSRYRGPAQGVGEANTCLRAGWGNMAIKFDDVGVGLPGPKVTMQ